MAARKARPTALHFRSPAIPVEARAKVLRLVDELGFDPVDAGGIEESWRQQPGTPCYTQDLNAVQLKAALAAAVAQPSCPNTARRPTMRRKRFSGRSPIADGARGTFELRNHSEPYGQTPRSTPASGAENCVETV